MGDFPLVGSSPDDIIVGLTVVKGEYTFTGNSLTSADNPSSDKDDAKTKTIKKEVDIGGKFISPPMVTYAVTHVDLATTEGRLRYDLNLTDTKTDKVTFVLTIPDEKVLGKVTVKFWAMGTKKSGKNN